MNNCHQCGLPTEAIGGNILAVCIRPDCPNYGLAQIVEENMQKFFKKSEDE